MIRKLECFMNDSQNIDDEILKKIIMGMQPKQQLKTLMKNWQKTMLELVPNGLQKAVKGLRLI